MLSINDEVIYKKKAASDSNVPCVINDLQVGETVFDIVEAKTQGSKIMSIGMSEEDTIYSVSSMPMDLVYSPLKSAENWKIAVPAESKEFVMLLSGGLIHRNCLLYKENGDWKVAIYKKKEGEPIVVLENDVFTTEIIDDGFNAMKPSDDKKYTVNRSMRILDVEENGSSVRLYVSSALDIHNDTMWWPQRLHTTVVEECGHPLATAFVGGCDKTLISKCMQSSWEAVGEWQSKALLKLIEVEDYDVIFSHFHNVDGQAHQLIKYLTHRPESKISPEEMLPLFENVYRLADDYLGEFLHLLDQGWTILVTSDHGQVCPAHKPPMICDSDVSLRVMQELGLTEVKRDTEGNELREIDWDKTYAINTRSNHVYLNLKGREPNGIIDPKDKYEWEEEIMTRLYGYRDKVTGKRIIALALRNKDAKLLGMGGEGSGDILIWTAEGYNYDHNDGLSTAYGEQHTSLNCIFAAAGPGIKKHFKTDRVIRQVDFAPTVCVLGGVRMPAQCEGAPVYQILED